MNKVKNFEEFFINELIEKYNYPREAVKSNLRGNSTRFDIIIQKGTMYIQAFEVKKKTTEKRGLEQQVHFLSQELNGISIDTPIYCVMYDKDGSWTLYDEKNLKKPITNVDKILNYREAVIKFLGLARENVLAIPKEIKWICWSFAAFMLINLVIYTLAKYGMNITPNMPTKLSIEWLIYVVTALVITIFPFLLSISKTIKRIKVGNFELELREKLDL